MKKVKGNVSRVSSTLRRVYWGMFIYTPLPNHRGAHGSPSQGACAVTVSHLKTLMWLLSGARIKCMILVSCSSGVFDRGVCTARQEHLRKSCICTLYKGPDPTRVVDKRESTVASREIETTVFDPVSQYLSNISRRV